MARAHTDDQRPWAPDSELPDGNRGLGRPFVLAGVVAAWTERLGRFGLSDETGPLLERRERD